MCGKEVSNELPVRNRSSVSPADHKSYDSGLGPNGKSIIYRWMLRAVHIFTGFHRFAMTCFIGLFYTLWYKRLSVK